MSKKEIIAHIIFLLSPFLISGLMVVSLLIGNTNLTDALIFIVEVYAAIFLLACSYVYFKMDKQNIASNVEASIVRLYPTIAAMVFGWIFLFPFMSREFGMWDSQFLNLFATLAMAYFIFFFLIGVYHLTSLLLPGKKVHS